MIGTRHRQAARRAKTPLSTAFIEQFEREFGSITVEYVCENGVTYDKRPDLAEMTAIHSRDMGSVSQWIANKGKK